MIDECGGRVLFGPIFPRKQVKFTMWAEICAYFAVHLLDIIIYPQLMTFRIRGNSLAGIPAHGDLMRLDETNLAILIKYSESISFSLENDADCLCAKS
jgi:hypothetical protein